MDLLIIFIFGLIIGSFLNVCISRLPKGESVVFPSSRCEACNTRLRFFDLVPVASFLLLKGKCRYCGFKLSWRYPGVEIITGILFVLIYLTRDWNARLISDFFWTSLLLVISFIDMDYYRIPDSLILIGLGAGLIFQIFIPSLSLSESILGFITGGGILFLFALISRGGMGGGDIKLGALAGVFLGWKLVILSLFLAALFASATGLFLIVTKRKSRKDPIPFGPFLSLGAFL